MGREARDGTLKRLEKKKTWFIFHFSFVSAFDAAVRQAA